MSLNFLELLQQFNSFKQMVNSSGHKPEELLNNELQKRNISTQQMNQLIQSAKLLSKILGVK